MADERKPVQKLAKGQRVQINRTLGEKIHDFFFEDGGSSSDILSDMVEDVVRPAINDMCYEIFMDFTDMVRGSFENLWFGSNSSRDRKYRGRTRRRDDYYYRSYDDYYDRSDRRRDKREDRRRLSRRNDNVAAMVLTKSEAINVVRGMQDRLAEPEYDYVPVRDFYDMCDVPISANDSNWGWTKRTGFSASIRGVDDGYVIEPNKPIWIGN